MSIAVRCRSPTFTNGEFHHTSPSFTSVRCQSLIVHFLNFPCVQRKPYTVRSGFVRSIIGVLTVLCLYTAVDSLILESFSDLRVSMLSRVSTVSTPQCPQCPQRPLHSVQSVHHSVSAPIASGAKPPLVTHRMIMICHGHHPGDSC